MIGSIASTVPTGANGRDGRRLCVRPGLHDRDIDEASANPAAAATTEGIAALQPGRPLAGRFAVVRKDRQQAKNGSPYLSIELRDRTGSIPARIFRDVDVIGSRFDRGDAVEVRGRVERFRGSLSAEVTALRRIEPGAFDPAEFLPSAYRSTDELNGFLEHLSREVYDPALRAVVERVLDTEPVASEFRRAPCTRGGHHAYLGGLLEHTVAVGTLVGEVCQLHPKLDSDLLMAAALLHDVGKVAIPKDLINKPGPLSDQEWTAVRTHTVEGQRMLEKIGGLMSEIGRVVRSCHERFDGGGYPDGLAAGAIPVESRIIFACDAFNAMTTDRPYRSAVSIEAAIVELEDNAGTQFDPEVVEVLIAQVRDRYGIAA
ncbi:MAG: HD domain-containing protein [Solirubrobacterales bacterium]|nr:HD domain-containing protein [Solirubrobacterales bacterium]